MKSPDEAPWARTQWYQAGIAPRQVPGASADPFAESRVLPLYTEDRVPGMLAELRAMLERDLSPQTREALRGELARGIESFWGYWFQRIDFPAHHISTTSDPKWIRLDEGGLNTLGGRLTSLEASRLRPWPKWLYIQPLLPDLRGKTVLELGSANGFFSFRFADAGAASVTGVEIVQRMYESALWSAGVLGHQRVRFLNTDFLLDLTLSAHDVVFLSEVHNHFLMPFYGLCRLVNLARETLILDTGARDTATHSLELASGWQRDPQRLLFHTFCFSDGLLLDFLYLIGVPPARITRYKAPAGNHILYVIDTRGVSERRRELDYPEYLRRVLELDFVLPAG
jgi:SAM-dependent methyltransferase